MSNGGLKIDARRKKILELLSRDGSVRVSELSAEMGATAVTIRNDLDSLERDGYLERIPGGAVQSVKNFYNIELQYRRQKNILYKRAVAAGVAELVRDGETLLINSGTTTYYAAVELKRRKNLNIVTNSIYIAVELSAHPSFRVLLLGGDTNPQYSFTHGSEALEQLRKYRADKAILSVAGIDADIGITTYHADEAQLDRLMMERARTSIVAADYTKLGQESFSNIGEVTRAGYIVTNGCGDAEQIARIREKGVELITC